MVAAQEAESEGRNRALHLAATNNHEQCVHMLLQRGACVTCKNDVRKLPPLPPLPTPSTHTHTGTHAAGPVCAGAGDVEGR